MMDSEQKKAILERSKERAAGAQVRVFRSFEAELEAELARRAAMTVEERFEEFSVIQERTFGDALRQPLVRVATWEYLDKNGK